VVTYVLDKVDNTIAGSLRTDEGTTPVQALASKHTGELVPQTPIGTKEVSNLPRTRTDITSYKDKISSAPNRSKDKDRQQLIDRGTATLEA